VRRSVALGPVLLLAAACGSLIDVDEGGVIDFEDLDEAGPSGVPALVNGIVGAYQEALDDVVRYATLMTDEMIMSGTFETRVDVDRRRIQPSNETLTGSIYTQIHVARMQADTAVALFEERLPDPAFASVETDMREGIALGKLYGGLSRLWLGEMYCWSILTGMADEATPVLPDARVEEARTFLVDAEGRAGPLGMEDVRLAAVVGQARAQLWLGNYAQATALALAVPRGFAYWGVYSYNEPEQFNEMYQFTWGDIEGIHWTVGDGTTPERGNERFAHFDEFVRLNLIEIEPEGFDAVSSATPVMLQKIYRRPDSRILIASGAEAQLIRAEVAARAGQRLVAEQLINDLRADYSFRATVNWGVEPPEPADALLPIVLTDTLATNLRRVAAERARELWLTGDRLTTSRRLRRDASVPIDLFPPVKTGVGGGDDIAFPMVQLELDANPNLEPTQACPAGQTIGAWR
jgi:hypothetical protein